MRSLVADDADAFGLKSSRRKPVQVRVLPPAPIERSLKKAEVPGTRKVAIRSALTMSPDREGIFDTLLGLVRCGLGGRAGDGRQYVSWVHEDDFVRAVYWLTERDGIHGPVNIAAPNPLQRSVGVEVDA